MKKFLDEKKRELKFKFAGPGHKLVEGGSTEPKNPEDIDAARLNAALKRCGKASPVKNIPSSSRPEKATASSSTPDNAMAHHKESITSDIASHPLIHENITPRPTLADGGVILFTCSKISDEVLPLHTWNDKIRAYIDNMESTDPVVASVIKIKSMNEESMVQQCLVIIERYINNLIEHPDIEKFKLIRLGNPNVQKILKVNGAYEFLEAIGFEKKVKDNEDYLIYNSTTEIDLKNALKTLESKERLDLKLHRDVKIITANQVNLEDHPDDFYEWSLSDIKREHKAKTDSLEKNLQLRTKKMRELDQKVPSKIPADYTQIRVRLPDGLYFQATFCTQEKLSDLRVLLSEKLDLLDEFSFVSQPAKIYDKSEEDKTFKSLNLYPKVLLMMKWSGSPDKKKYTLKEQIPNIMI